MRINIPGVGVYRPDEIESDLFDLVAQGRITPELAEETYRRVIPFSEENGGLLEEFREAVDAEDRGTVPLTDTVDAALRLLVDQYGRAA